jgi:hypothetical protein
MTAAMGFCFCKQKDIFGFGYCRRMSGACLAHAWMAHAAVHSPSFLFLFMNILLDLSKEASHNFSPLSPLHPLFSLSPSHNGRQEHQVQVI